MIYLIVILYMLINIGIVSFSIVFSNKDLITGKSTCFIIGEFIGLIILYMFCPIVILLYYYKNKKEKKNDNSGNA